MGAKKMLKSAMRLLKKMLDEANIVGVVSCRASLTPADWVEADVYLYQQSEDGIDLYMQKLNARPTIGVDYNLACTAAVLEVIAQLAALQMRGEHGPAPRPGDMHESWYDDAVVDDA